MKRQIGLLALVLVQALAACGDVTMSKIGEYSFAVNGCGGITYAGGNLFYVLRDHDDSSGGDGKAQIINGTVVTEDGKSVWRATVPSDIRFFRPVIKVDD